MGVHHVHPRRGVWWIVAFCALVFAIAITGLITNGIIW
jgi:hypothetical protein